MSEFLKRKDIELKNMPFTEWNIEDIFWGSDACDDGFEYLINKYNDVFYESKKNVSHDDALIAIDLYDDSYNVLIKCVLDFLIALSSERNKSNLVKDLEQLIDLYFNNIENIDAGFSDDNLVTVLKWTIIKFPESKPLFRESLFQKLMSFDKSIIRAFFLAVYFISDKDVCTIFTNEQYYEIFQKYYVSSSNREKTRLYNEFLKFFKKNNKEIHKKILKQYCDFVINCIDCFDNHSSLSIFSEVRRYMDEVKGYSDSDYIKVDNRIETAGKEVLKEMQSITIELPKEKEEQLKEEIQKQIESFSALSNEAKIEKLLFESNPISLNNLKEYNEKCKNRFSTMFFNESVIDEEGKPIFYSDLSPEDSFSLRAKKMIEIYVRLICDLLISPFFNSFILDENAIAHIKKILSNSKLISPDKVDTMTEIISAFFEQDFRYSVYNLCEEFEDCLRFYFKTEKMNVYKRDGSGDVIGLNNIFNNFDKNSFRDKLLETIDEDYYFTLKWFLTDDYGFGLRNKIAHRYKSKDLYKKIFSIFASVQIIRLIWYFQK